MLRDLERIPLNTPQARDGYFFNDTLQTLFRLIRQGTGASTQQQLTASTVRDTFTLAPLDSRLFDPATTPLLNRVCLPNWVWQQVVERMSLSRTANGRTGRVSYQLLSINQLGAVYEALLSYRGFFASEDLYEVTPAPKNGKTQVDSDEEGDEDSDEGEFGDTTDLLENAWFVPASRIGDYKPSEIVTETDENGHKRYRVHRKGEFVYRLAGRDRKKSASYYTPQVLTRCLVKYALKELLEGKTADEILKLTVCEPAMGSAAFLNEGVNQLAEAYLERKQSELGKHIPHQEYAQELQKVRMYLADRNVFGVDLNPVAVELAEVSLWLNAIYGEQDPDGRPRPARVPWFGYQLFSGNSLIGARPEVYPAALLISRSNTKWHKQAPRRLNPQDPDRGPDEIYHFLLPDPAMADYSDKAAKALYPDEFARLKSWRKEFCQPLESYEIKLLQELSSVVDDLWAEHAAWLSRDRKRTEDPLPVWPDSSKTGSAATEIASKERIREEGLWNRDEDQATPYRRLKLVLDYWCALWFWPIESEIVPPSREEWWQAVSAILRGNIVDLNPQGALDFQATGNVEVPADWTQARLTAAQPTAPRLHDRFGILRISRLRGHFPHVKEVERISETRSFFHWELAFADIFRQRGGFDLILGNPPWLRVEWKEAGILGEKNPLFAIRDYSAAELNALRVQAFEEFQGLQASWLSELEESEATQSFLNAPQNFPLLLGMKANLYKCFLPVGWRISRISGIAGFLHPEGPYEDTNGALLRQVAYSRLRAHFQFINEMGLFADVHNLTRYSINIYGTVKSTAGFTHISNLFTPATVDACFEHDGSGEVGGYKTTEGKWNTVGHKDRIISVTETELTLFAGLFDEPNTPPRQARLPSLHAGALLSVLEKIGNQPRRLGSLGNSYVATNMFDENKARREGTTRRDPGFITSPEDWILSGPHFSVASPFNKTPRRVVTANRHYDCIDLESIPDDYLPRTIYRPAADREEYLRHIPIVPWTDAAGTPCGLVTDYYRLAFRRQLSQSGERTLFSALVPRSVAHIHPVLTLTFQDSDDLINFSSLTASIIYDFLIKTTGRSDVYEATLKPMPLPDRDDRRDKRLLSLVCLASHWRQLWDDWHAKHFPEPAGESRSWTRDRALRTPLARRQALIEIDVLVAQSLGLTLKELLLIYRVQFPVMQQYERDTWYDASGSIIFTTSKGLAGVGLPRKAGKKDPEVTRIYKDGKVRKGRFGWEDVRDAEPGTIISVIATDDTLPGGPRQRERRWVAPFAIADREEDYRIAWEFFAEQSKLAEGA